VKKLLGCDALHTLLPRSSENDRQIDSTNVAALKQPKISLTGDFMSTSNTISKIGAVSYIIWACLHLLAVYSVYVLGRSLDSSMVQGRVFQDAMIPMGRMGKPEEIASAAVFLASDDNRSIDANQRRDTELYGRQ
jgi:hypothetical protein